MKRTLVAIVLIAIACGNSPKPSMIQDAAARNVTVEIAREKRGDFDSSCSGVVISTGYILTAAHCIGLQMKVGGNDAEVVAFDDPSDLLLLKVWTPKFSRLEININPSIGDEIFTVCNFLDFTDVFLRGSVSGVGLTRVLSQFPGSPGVSGSVMYDMSGRLVGLNSQYVVSRFPMRQKSDQAVVVLAGETIVFSLSTHPKTVAEFLKGRG
jgi:S1-C subfamily serine protease